MTRQDEPNEFGWAGDATAPEPEPPHRRDVEKETAEATAVPSSDLTSEFSEALAEGEDQDQDQDPAQDRSHP